MVSNDTGTKDGEALMGTIVGARLTSVQFVLDYLILGFDERGALTTLVWPEISHGGNAVKFGMSGYRDRLCGLITHLVTEVKFLEPEVIVILFDDDSRVQIPLRNRELPGERAIFTAPKHRLYVW